MTPEEQSQAIGDLREDVGLVASSVAEMKGVINNGIKLMIAEHKVELGNIKGEVASIKESVTAHIAKEDVLFNIFSRTLNTGIALTGGLITVLLAIIGYLLTHPGFVITTGKTISSLPPAPPLP